MHLVVMLPKNQTIERPITLTSVLYRVWCRLRKPLLDEWQRNLPPHMNHDRARPGANVLQVALERLLRQEVYRANGQHGVTVLMDMSTFYHHPAGPPPRAGTGTPVPTNHAGDGNAVYTGPKAIVAEQEMTPFFHVTKGVPAGCPQAPLLAKAVLAPALTPWQEQRKHIHLSSWVDDVGYDTAGKHPQQVPNRQLKHTETSIKDSPPWVSKSAPKRPPSLPQTNSQTESSKLCSGRRAPSGHSHA